MDTALLARYLEFRPAWQAFGVYFFGVLVFFGGPFINPDAALSPALSETLGTCFAAFILLKRFTCLYKVEGGRITAQKTFPKQDVQTAAIEDIVRIDLRRGISQRLLGVAHVHLYVEGADEPAVKLFGVPKPDDFHRLLMKMGANDQKVTGAWRR